MKLSSRLSRNTSWFIKTDIDNILPTEKQNWLNVYVNHFITSQSPVNNETNKRKSDNSHEDTLFLAIINVCEVEKVPFKTRDHVPSCHCLIITSLFKYWERLIHTGNIHVQTSGTKRRWQSHLKILNHWFILVATLYHFNFRYSWIDTS